MRTIVPIVCQPNRPGVPAVGYHVTVDDNGPNGQIHGTTNKDGYTLDDRTGQAPQVNDSLPFYVQVTGPDIQPYAFGCNGRGNPAFPNVNFPDTGNFELIIGRFLQPLQPHQVQCPELTAVSVRPEPPSLASIVNYSFFDGYHRHLDGTLRDAALTQVYDLGARMVRVFMNWGNIGFDPASYGDRFFSEIPVFWNRLANHGLSGEMVLLAGKPFAPSVASLADQQAFVSRCRTARRGVSNGIEELGNELYLPENHFDFTQFAPPIDWLASSGAEIDWGAPGGGPLLWQIVSYHGERFGHHIVDDMLANEATLFTGKRCWNDEPAKGPDYNYDPSIAGQMGRAGDVLGNKTFHSGWGEGQNCQLLTGRVLECAQEFYAANRRGV